eukprot:12893441-Prorocentrum_lima.AAC.1
MASLRRLPRVRLRRQRPAAKDPHRHRFNTRAQNQRASSIGDPSRFTSDAVSKGRRRWPA